MDKLLFGLVVSSFFSIFIVLSKTLHGRFTNDDVTTAVQKFHSIPVPRIGGVALFIALFAVWCCLIYQQQQISHTFGWLLIASLPIFSAGTLEDITQKIQPRFRLYVSFLSAALVFSFLQIHFCRIDWPWFDSTFLSIPFIAFLFTLLVIGSTIHAMNLIDGFNGLMLGVSLFMFAGIGVVSYQVNDWIVLQIALICFGCIAGLFLVNFPYGKIFAGDSGAYLVGFLLGTTVLMLVQRNPKVSAWFPCLLLIYPLFETAFSMYRKIILRKMAAMRPDGVHLHMLIYKRIARHIIKRHQSFRNSLTSPYLWVLSLLGIIPAILYWDSTIISMGFCFIFLLSYLRLYWHLVMFKKAKSKLLRLFKQKSVTEKLLKELI